MTIYMPTTPGFRASKFGLETKTRQFESVSGYVQRQQLGGARWRATYTLPMMTRAQAAAWQSFFLQLRGSVNTFWGFDPDAVVARGVATGSPLVNGADQTGYSLVTDGWTSSTTNILMAGDYFVVNNELKMITQNVNSDSGGNATLSFAPSLIASPANNAPISLSNPVCMMVLADDSQAQWESDYMGVFSEKTFAAFEVYS